MFAYPSHMCCPTDSSIVSFTELVSGLCRVCIESIWRIFGFDTDGMVPFANFPMQEGRSQSDRLITGRGVANKDTPQHCRVRQYCLFYRFHFHWFNIVTNIEIWSVTGFQKMLKALTGSRTATSWIFCNRWFIGTISGRFSDHFLAQILQFPVIRLLELWVLCATPSRTLRLLCHLRMFDWELHLKGADDTSRSITEIRLSFI